LSGRGDPTGIVSRRAIRRNVLTGALLATEIGAVERRSQKGTKTLILLGFEH
jgi:hypothetical protein